MGVWHTIINLVLASCGPWVVAYHTMVANNFGKNYKQPWYGMHAPIKG